MVARGDKAFTEGFAILDADGGWDLLCSLIQYEPSARLSASGALAHPWFGVATPTAVLSSTVASLAACGALPARQRVYRRGLQRGLGAGGQGQAPRLASLACAGFAGRGVSSQRSLLFGCS